MRGTTGNTPDGKSPLRQCSVLQVHALPRCACSWHVRCTHSSHERDGGAVYPGGWGIPTYHGEVPPYLPGIYTRVSPTMGRRL